MIDWIAKYLEHAERYPVLSRVQPGDIRAQLPEHPPAQGEPFETMMRDVERIIMPGLTHWQSPNFFAFFPSNTSGPSILGELLSAGLGVQGMLWATSPACTELETHVLDWLVEMLDLPGKFSSGLGGDASSHDEESHGGGVIQDTASSATLCAMLAARERATGFHSNETGMKQTLICYASTQAHSLIEKSAAITGIGKVNLRSIDVDARFAMRVDLLEEAIVRDVEAGRVPFFVNATVGTTSSNAMDPLRAIGERLDRVARDTGIARPWLHVDAAMSGTAALCPEFRFIHDGIEHADSYCFNPHKWMFTNFDCNCFHVADRSALIRTLSVLPEYLKNEATESGAVFDYRDWHIPLGRRFRALKLWFVVRHYGIEGLQHHVREHVRLAQEFASWIDASDDFDLIVPPPLNLVCFAHKNGDEATQRILDTLNESGELYLSHTKLNDRYVIRMSIGQAGTTEAHVRAAWERIQQAAQAEG